MNVLDIIYIVAIIVALFVGYKCGFLERISLTLGIAAGLFNATVLQDTASRMLLEATGWDRTVVAIISYAAIMVLSIVMVKLIVALLIYLLKKLELEIINKLAGAILAAIMAAIVATALVDVSSLLLPDNEVTGESIRKESFFYDKIVKGIYKDTLTGLF
jgi:uncharacterized membrane protein required for colicin V production